MKASRRALIIGSITEVVGVALYALASVVQLPFGLAVAIASLHFPAMYAMDNLRLPLGETQRLVAVASLQWLFWIFALGISFYVVDIYRSRRQKHG